MCTARNSVARDAWRLVARFPVGEAGPIGVGGWDTETALATRSLFWSWSASSSSRRPTPRDPRAAAAVDVSGSTEEEEEEAWCCGRPRR